MSSAIFTTKEKANKYRSYLKRIYKSNIQFLTSEHENEVVYNIPFPELVKTL